MGYVCMRPMKVQVAPGKVEWRKPGDPMPEVEEWSNPALWVRRGYVGRDDGKPVPGLNRERMLPMRVSTPEDIRRGTRGQVPKPGKPLPGYQGKGNVKPLDGKKGSVPTLEEVIAAGYDERAATGIVASEQAQADGGTKEDASIADAAATAAWDADHPSTTGLLDDRGDDADGDALPPEADTISELIKMSRAELEAFATDRGLTDPSGFPNKEVLAQAILETSGE